jgi:enamine deaminase RidA (YjgF/YER057c/UK114 family)
VEQRKINPWKWQDQYGFSQAIEVSNASRVLYCAGQASVDDTGKPVQVGDIPGLMIEIEATAAK